ncbi:hypothetical protein [Clostridium sp.]|uniref:hypothetical protein n=1 Tax=Clostridium sp. TaxID=1506 RepID=UPI002903C8B4|nr:hypothetical protein [Clostridium sp.]MDU2106557.1 hypothetical protein [Clostridium sp.]MDU3353575.1 hypothetical protein [Clostridium sp.]
MKDVLIIINDSDSARKIVKKVEELYLDPITPLTKEKALREAVRQYQESLKAQK